jgi:hypothetical protein
MKNKNIENFHIFIVFVILFAAFYRFNISLRYLFPFILGCMFVYHYRNINRLIETRPLYVFVDGLQFYQEYNPQQYQLLKEEVTRYEYTNDSTELLNVFHDFIHTLPLNMLHQHRQNMTKLERIVPRTNTIHDDFNTYRFYA